MTSDQHISPPLRSDTYFEYMLRKLCSQYLENGQSWEFMVNGKCLLENKQLPHANCAQQYNFTWAVTH